MSKIRIQGSSGTGTTTLTSASSNTDKTITLPDSTGTVLMTDGDGSNLSNVGVDGIVSTANSTAMTISSSEHIAIGTSSPALTESRQAGRFLTIYGTATNGSILELASNKNTDNNTVGIVSFVNTENADTSGGSRLYLAQIRTTVETNDSNAQGDSGGNLVFQTKADGGTIDDRLIITSDGRGLSQFTAKAWVNINGHSSGSGLIRDSHNVSSITDNGSGNYTTNFSNNMANSNYCAVGVGSEADSSNIGSSGEYSLSNVYSRSTSSVRVQAVNWQDGGSTLASDFYSVDIVIFGD